MNNSILLAATTILSLVVPFSPCLADNSHFESLLSSPNLHAAFSLRSQAEINSHTHGQGQLPNQPGGNNPQVQYDSTIDAAKVTINAGSGSLGLAWQLRPTYPAIDKSNATEASVQWEVRWDSSYLNLRSHGLTNHKAFQIAEKTGDDRHIEMQTRFAKAETGAVALPTVRTYGTSNGGIGIRDPLTTDEGTYFNWQPGGDTSADRKKSYSAAEHLAGQAGNNAFVLRPNKWIRYTASLTFTGGQQRLRLWMSDEDTPPVLVIADPNDPTKGFLVDTATDTSGTDHFWVEFNTSQEGTTNPALIAWVRNIVVFKDATVPLGTFDEPDTTAPAAPSSVRLTP